MATSLIFSRPASLDLLNHVINPEMLAKLKHHQTSKTGHTEAHIENPLYDLYETTQVLYEQLTALKNKAKHTNNPSLASVIKEKEELLNNSNNLTQKRLDGAKFLAEQAIDRLMDTIG